MHKQEKTELERAGWRAYSGALGLKLEDNLFGRVAVENKTNYLVITEQGEMPAILRGNMIKSKDFPKVGDWVEYSLIPGDDKIVIEKVLPRKTLIARTDGETEERQEIAANVDTLFIVQALDKDFSLPRLERYLVLSRESGVKPIILLNKTDIKEDHVDELAQVKAIAMDVPVYPVSAKNRTGLSQVKEYIKPGETVAFMGSSGAGKSSLINAIIGLDIQATGEVRLSDSRGKHTTTKREMIILPEGGILVDTPGIRELGMGAGTAGFNDVFDDVDDLSLQCRFSNCDHEKSLGCAIQDALSKGELDPARYERYMKLKREIDYLESKTSKKKEMEKKKHDKKLSKNIKQFIKRKRE